MYFNATKERRLGYRIEGGKLQRKISRSVEQLRRHDPDIEISDEPTQHLFVSNSSVLCGVSLDELECIFQPFDNNCSFIVYPNKRSYSFVSFSTVDRAAKAQIELNGLVHPELKSSHQPFIVLFVKKLVSEEGYNLLYPKDLQVIEDFITEEDERGLLDVVRSNDKAHSLKHRTVVHYGYEFDYDTNSAFRKSDTIPPVINRLINKIMEGGYAKFRPDQVTLNVYEPGQGIPSHYDTHSAFQDSIVSLSLLSDVVMEFKDGANSARIIPVLLKRRSLCVIQGESRYRWKHGIANRKHDIDPITHRVIPRHLRVSLTLRKIRTEPCQCNYKEFCDWDRQGEMSVPTNDECAKRLEDSYVADVYENISSHFDETRHASWRAVKIFIDSIPRNSLLYDIGCGNGKYLVPRDGLIKIGCDMCHGLCCIAANKGCLVIRSDALHLPFREEGDAVICIAVLHHLASLRRRQQLIEEIIRVMRPGGRACITVWSMDQHNSEYAKMRDNKETSNFDKRTKCLKVHDGKEFVQQDVLVPWTNDVKGQTFLRYYHVFRDGEMEDLIRSIKGCRLESIEKEQGNYIAIISKL